MVQKQQAPHQSDDKTQEKSSKRGEYAPTVHRKSLIAHVVLEVIDAQGYEAVSLARISEMTGIGQTSISCHFPSRDHLLVRARAAHAQTRRGARAYPPTYGAECFRR
ncbi:TetR/AcrR family transcriptional regulator [Alloscardovia criceti]|uniref:TetR/AcrR family transcriptional regulator n=1 Tax=Alloscardovia criceti TaxID=356828 RepID=UPI000A068E3C